MLETLKRLLRKVPPVRRSYRYLKQVYGRWTHPLSGAELLGMDASFHTSDPGHYRRVQRMMGERAQLEAFVELLEPGDTVWDVGAHMGMYSIFAAKKLAEIGGRVLSFEPDPSMRELLGANRRINGLEHIEIHPFGLGSESGSALLRRPEMSGGATLDTGRDLGFELEPSRIEIRRGDNLIADGLPSPDVLKMDIEGAEYDALSGMPDALASCRAVLIEVHTKSRADGRSVRERVRELLEAQDFDIAMVGERGAQEHWLCTRA
jgi:FkbM family methyltransferase